MGDTQHIALGQRGPYFSNTPMMCQFFKEKCFGYEKMYWVTFLDLIASHSFLIPIASKSTLLCSHRAVRLLMSTQEKNTDLLPQ